jgi:YHS domain-containing protein
MTVDPDQTELVSLHKGRRYFFCAENCRKSFEANPKKYLEAKHRKKKGRLGRYLERMAKINEKEFGCSRHRCH